MKFDDFWSQDRPPKRPKTVPRRIQEGLQSLLASCWFLHSILVRFGLHFAPLLARFWAPKSAANRSRFFLKLHCSNIPSKTAYKRRQECPKRPQNRPKSPQNRPRRFPRPSKEPPKAAPRAYQEVSRGPKRHPRRPNPDQAFRWIRWLAKPTDKLQSVRHQINWSLINCYGSGGMREAIE